MRDTASPDTCDVLVTGGEGFVGRWLLDALRAGAGAGRVVATTRIAEAPSPDVITLDVCDAAATRALVRALKPRAVVHLAAISAVQEARADVERTWAINLTGTRNLAEAVLREAPGARFLFVSTAEVYGGTFNVRGDALDETALLDPSNPYAASKAAADLLVGQMARDGLRAVRLRPFNHTGPGQSEAFVVPAFAAQIARIEAGRQADVLRVGNLDACRDFLDVRDVVEAYRRVIAAPDDAIPAGTIFNVASGVPRRIGDILQELIALARTEIRVEVDPARLRPSEVPRAIGAADRIEATLGWRPAIPWRTTIADLLDACRAALAGEP